MKQEDTMSVQKMTKMALCVALCCVAAYISVPLPFTTAMITALTLAMNLTAFILKPRETFAVLCVYTLPAIFVGIPLTYVGGLTSMMLLMDVSLWQALVMAVFPFIPGDVLKAALAAFLGVKLNRVFRQYE